MKLLMITALAFITCAANAANFSCTDLQNSTQKGVFTTLAGQLKVQSNSDLTDLIPSETLNQDQAYKPRPQHAGSIRFEGTNDCGSFYLILDKNMAAGLAGYMTIQQDCDSDGTGPSYQNFSCSKI